jgi:hypothetical protein
MYGDVERYDLKQMGQIGSWWSQYYSFEEDTEPRGCIHVKNEVKRIQMLFNFSGIMTRNML